MDRQPEPQQESLTTDHSSGTQRNRSNVGIHDHDGMFDDGTLLHDTEAAVHSFHIEAVRRHNERKCTTAR